MLQSGTFQYKGWCTSCSGQFWKRSGYCVFLEVSYKWLRDWERKSQEYDCCSYFVGDLVWAKLALGSKQGLWGACCEIMRAFTALQLQLLAGREQKSLEPFPSSFQWELLCPWPSAQDEGSQQWAKCSSSLRTFSCLYLIVVLQIYFKWKNTEKKEQKSSLLRFRRAGYIFVHLHLSVLEKLELILGEELQYLIWKQNRNSSYLEPLYQITVLLM